MTLFENLAHKINHSEIKNDKELATLEHTIKTIETDDIEVDSSILEAVKAQIKRYKEKNQGIAISLKKLKELDPNPEWIKQTAPNKEGFYYMFWKVGDSIYKTIDNISKYKK